MQPIWYPCSGWLSMAVDDQSPDAVSQHPVQTTARNKAGSAGRTKRARALKIVYAYVALSGSVGLIPLPLLDQVLIGGLLGKMIQDLCRLYGVPVTGHKAKTILAAVLGGSHAEWISRYLLIYLNKFLPRLSSAGRIVTRPIVSAATAYAVGLLFVHHFDKGAWVKKELIVQPDAESFPSPLAAAPNG